MNILPFRSKGIRWNDDVIYIEESPVGVLSLPYHVGSEGPISDSNFEVFF